MPETIGWESVISLPSEVASGSLLRLLKFLLVFKLAVRFAAGSALVLMRRAPAQYYSVFPAKGRDLLRAMIAIDHSRYVLVALRHGAKFRGEARLVLFLLPRCGFPVVCYSQQFSRALSQNKKTEELVRTERLPLQSIRCTCRSIYALLPADLVSAGPAPGAALRMLHA